MTNTIQTSKRGTERPSFIRRWAGASGLLLLALAAAGGCQARAIDSAEGSPSPFLRSCSSACEAGLVCVCGVCTLPCEQDLECGELGAGAACVSAGSACAGAPTSCTVECEFDDDCALLAGDMACVAGRCQGPALPATLRQGASGTPVVGQPCVTADERFAAFSGFALGEVNVEDGGESCGSELVCLVNRFQGRVTCPEGQAEDALGGCLTSQGEPVSVPVEPQLSSRPAERHVICSCRCAGPEPGADYCDCPSGMQCEELITAGGAARSAYAGSYCTYPAAPESSDPSGPLDDTP